jgi:uncharacterized protein YtpQ (UPF0354 family)
MKDKKGIRCSQPIPLSPQKETLINVSFFYSYVYNLMNADSIIQTHRSKIYPWVKLFLDESVINENEVKITGVEFPIYRPWLADLAIFYVADMDNHYQIILPKDLPDSFSVDELHELAISNLQSNITYKIHPAEFGGYGLICGSDLEATSITLPGIWEDVGEYVGANLVVAVIARDLILFVPENDGDRISNLKIFMHQFFKAGEKLLSNNLFAYNIVSKQWKIVHDEI